jgi:RNA-directed DNA polymerase
MNREGHGRAGRRKPLWREQQGGPQHQANTAASTELQRESRAAHVTAKARSGRDKSPRESTGQVSPGYGVAARAEGLVRNRRGPSAPPTSGKDRSYKPKVKGSGAQRESEGVVVPPMGVDENAPEGKGPCFGHAGNGETREGMAGQTGPNHPGGHEPAIKVRHLQRRLWAAAKRSPERRFHALYDRVFRGDVLEEAWRRVRANRGAAGVDRETLAEVEAYGVERLLAELHQTLKAGRYRPSPVRRRSIPKPGGGERQLGIPTVRDRIVQQAAKLVLEPVFEADFLDASYGYRPKRSATEALERIRRGFIRGYAWVLEFDIRSFFDSIDQERLLRLVERRVSDRRVVKLVRQWLRAGAMEDGVTRETVMGTPQGGVISPLLANIYLHEVDRAWAAQGQGELVRYADDGVVLCRSEAEAEAALELMRGILTELGLELHPDKTRVIDLREGRAGFDFLGCHFHARVSGRLLERGIRRYYLHRWPSQRSMKRVRQRVRELTGRNRNGVKDVRVLIRDINPILQGWGNYFRTGNAATKFIQVDNYVWRRLRSFLVKRHGRNLHAGRADRWTSDWFHELGLYRLRGTIRYPEVA